MHLEKRTRVEIFLPIRFDALQYKTVTEWLAEELAYARGGSTLTSPFSGLYVSNAVDDIVRDKVQVLFCDFLIDLNRKEDFTELATYLNDVRSLMQDVLDEEEIWITCHPVLRAA
ncbi:MAG TPA: hypothetical protein VFH31_06155 [Pyrinomonadaceae bacterium]|nr:hypothetical protein [Pyrinomonadaceae bacterium]